MEASENCINLIKRWESFSPEVYRCPAGILTQGYGHTRTVTALSQPISEFTAETFLKQDVLFIEHKLKRLLKGIDVNQNQYDAIVSFCFNLGVGAFNRSFAYAYMYNDVNDKHIADSWITFRNAGGKFLRGLLLRRLDELKLYYS